MKTYFNIETDPLLALADELCLEQREVTETAWHKACLVWKHLWNTGRGHVDDRGDGGDLERQVGQCLVAWLRSEQLSPIQRATVGDTLACLGDPRFRADAWYLPDEPLLGLVEIPEGMFLMGTLDGLGMYWNEAPQHGVYLPRYYIARYPVTVAQFWAFVETTGYAWSGKESSQGLSNHPVVWITWHDAIAYCDWLTEQLQAWPWTPEPLATLLRRQGWRVVLPSEAEWEKAARGPDGRRYPWGEYPDPNRANYDRTFRVGRTSSVGCFPQGVSPYKLDDQVFRP